MLGNQHRTTKYPQVTIFAQEAICLCQQISTPFYRDHHCDFHNSPSVLPKETTIQIWHDQTRQQNFVLVEYWGKVSF
jgi:hypothetical protein